LASDHKTIGKYRIDGVLGKGAMGIVYKGYDSFIDRQVAIKTIHKSLLSSEMGQEMMERFSNEAKAVGRLTHANIVGIFDFDIEDGMPYFVMELVHGRELKTMIKEKHRFTTEQVVSMICQVLDGLAYTHGFGIVHRDIKPANIFVLDDGTIKIADFGIARVDNSELTQIGSVLGTPSYMSPEQCLGERVDARSDLFSTAIMAYELLTGKKAFRGDMSNTIMHNVVNTDAVDPSKLNETLPSAFDSVLRKALAKKAEQRFQTADDFKDALLGCLRGKGVGLPKQKMIAIAAASVFVLSLAGGGLLYVSSGGQEVSKRVVVEKDATDAEMKKTAAIKNNPYLKIPEKKEVTEPEDIRKINRLLKAARAHLLVGRLVAPAGGNAYDAYQIVLEIDPYSREAIDGLNNVANKFFDRCEALYGQGILAESRNFVTLGMELFPYHRGLQELDQKLNAVAAAQ